MAESTEEMTPLKQKLDEFGAFLSKVLRPSRSLSPSVFIDLSLPCSLLSPFKKITYAERRSHN